VQPLEPNPVLVTSHSLQETVSFPSSYYSDEMFSTGEEIIGVYGCDTSAPFVTQLYPIVLVEDLCLITNCTLFETCTMSYAGASCGPKEALCGNSFCETAENCTSCPVDCCPGNENCASAVNVSLGTAYTGSTAGASG
jgi:hypothetical protein